MYPTFHLLETPSLAIFPTFEWFPVWWQSGSCDGHIQSYKRLYIDNTMSYHF